MKLIVEAVIPTGGTTAVDVNSPDFEKAYNVAIDSSATKAYSPDMPNKNIPTYLGTIITVLLIFIIIRKIV